MFNCISIHSLYVTALREVPQSFAERLSKTFASKLFARQWLRTVRAIWRPRNGVQHANEKWKLLMWGRRELQPK